MIFKQKKIYYRLVVICNLDGTYDTSTENEDCFCTIKAAQEALESEVNEYGMTGYIYECTPVLKATRGKIRITKLEATK